MIVCIDGMTAVEEAQPTLLPGCTGPRGPTIGACTKFTVHYSMLSMLRNGALASPWDYILSTQRRLSFGSPRFSDGYDVLTEEIDT